VTVFSAQVNSDRVYRHHSLVCSGHWFRINSFVCYFFVQ